MSCTIKHIAEFARPERDNSWHSKIEALYRQQLSTWEMAAKNYKALENVEKRSIRFGHFRIDIQHNPGRERSTCAKTDHHSIEQRPCFLCSQNRPPEQKGLLISKRYLLLINPFPIFNRHLTISDVEHEPQNIAGRVPEMLEITRQLENYTVLYNGPRCGASAPDHLHFQAVEKGKFPIDNEVNSFSNELKKQLLSKEQIQIFSINNYLRYVVVLEAQSIELIVESFEKIMKSIPFETNESEQRINLLANYENGTYRLTLFPRTAQRPEYFFMPEPQRIVVSAASVEMGGLIILPRKEDFNKIDKSVLAKIYADTSLDLDKINFNF
jgi:ATP adenylyltransferase/5',5'''-P-1,P-4-tetraphosphate phosphorylase II